MMLISLAVPPCIVDGLFDRRSGAQKIRSIPNCNALPILFCETIDGNLNNGLDLPFWPTM